MKSKKKEIIHEKVKQKKQQVVEAVKMQENLQKLNEFVRKQMENSSGKRGVRLKKNSTMRNGDTIINDTTNIIISKSNIKRDQDREEDPSSKLSTEFYEEYFRLLSSIQKEQTMIQSSGAKQSESKLKSPTSSSSNKKKKRNSHSPMSFLQNAQVITSPT